MNNINEKNRNYKRINDKIINAYYEILLKQGNDDTSITDLCKTAKINRTTFYKHYKDVSEISSELEAEFIYKAFSTKEDADLVSFMKNPCPKFALLNKNVLANKALYKAMLRPERLAIFIEKISHYLYEDVLKYRPNNVKLFKNKEELKLCIFNLVNPITCAYSLWLREKIKLPIEEVSRTICESIRALFNFSDRYKPYR